MHTDVLSGGFCSSGNVSDSAAAFILALDGWQTKGDGTSE